MIDKVLDKIEQQVDAAWKPACGGTEQPFQLNGRIYLYMYNSLTGEHAHYCQTTDLFLNKEEWVALLQGSFS